MRNPTHYRRLLVQALLLCLAFAATARAGTVTYQLGAPTVNGSTVSFDLSASYQPTGAYQLVEFQIDVSGSSPELSHNHTDYSAFSFALAPGLTPGWAMVVPFAAAHSTAEADTPPLPLLTPYAPLGAGDHLLGTLSLHLDQLGLTSLTPYVVRIDAAGTKAGEEVPNVPGTFGDADVRFGTSTPAVPLPSAVWAALPLLGGLAVARSLRPRS